MELGAVEARVDVLERVASVVADEAEIAEVSDDVDTEVDAEPAAVVVDDAPAAVPSSMHTSTQYA